MPVMADEPFVIDPATNLRTALAMADAGIRMKRESLRRSHPDASEKDLTRLLQEWLDSKPVDFPGLRRASPRSRS